MKTKQELDAEGYASFDYKLPKPGQKIKVYSMSTGVENEYYFVSYQKDLNRRVAVSSHRNSGGFFLIETPIPCWKLLEQ